MFILVTFFMKKFNYFLNYKKFMYSGFHLLSILPDTFIFSYKFFFAKKASTYVIDLRHTFISLTKMLYFLQFFIKNYGFFFFFFNKRFLDEMFYSLLRNSFQSFLSVGHVRGFFSNNILLKLHFNKVVQVTKNLVVLYLDNLLSAPILKELWSLNICVIGIGTLQATRQIFAKYLTYILPVNLLSLKSIYFFSFFFFFAIKFSFFEHKKYYKLKYFF